MEHPEESFGSAMRTAGYSEAQSKNPHQVMRSRTWQQLMEECLPKEKVATVLAEQLEATQIYILGGQAKERPDNQARLRAVDIALRLRGAYAAEKRDNRNINFSLADLRRMREAGEI